MPVNSARRGWIPGLHDSVMGAIWILGSLSIVLHGTPENLEAALGIRDPKSPGGAALRGVLAAGESWLGLRLWWAGGPRVRLLSAVAMGGAFLWLVRTGMGEGWDIPCGCFRGVAESTVAVGALRNLALATWSAAVWKGTAEFHETVASGDGRG